MEIINRGEVVGCLTNWMSDMWYLEGQFIAANTPAAVQFAAAASALELLAAFNDHTKGIRALLRQSAEDEGKVFIVMSLKEGRLFGRRVFEPEAVQWTIDNVSE